jgi:hypothetical protein
MIAPVFVMFGLSPVLLFGRVCGDAWPNDFSVALPYFGQCVRVRVCLILAV